MHLVKDASYVSDYKICITFNDGIKKVVDLAPHLDGEIFELLKDLDYFKKFYVNTDIDTIVWPNDADFSPDFLFEIGTIADLHPVR